jgi:hypothetical protein
MPQYAKIGNATLRNLPRKGRTGYNKKIPMELTHGKEKEN